MKIVIATSNADKIKELQKILPSEIKGKSIEYISLKDFPGFRLPPENGATLQENAIMKALSAAQYTKMPAIADDTGLEVDVLGGAPGVKSARWAGEYADYNANNIKLLRELEGQVLEARTARFKTAAAFARPDAFVVTCESVLEGAIGFGYRGENGFGYDPLFIVKGTKTTLAELSLEEKNEISHRTAAFKELTRLIEI